MTVDRAGVMIKEWQQACDIRTGSHQIGTASAPILQQHNTDVQLPSTRVQWQRPPEDVSNVTWMQDFLLL